MSKSMVVYFSASKAGRTKRLAETIAGVTGADLFAIEPVTPYTDEDLDWTRPGCRSVEEMRQPGCRPPIQGVGPDLADVETVYLGFPIWCWIAPTIVNTWLEAVDLTGKTVIPFATSGGSAYRNANDSLVASAPGAKFLPGRVVPADATQRLSGSGCPPLPGHSENGGLAGQSSTFPQGGLEPMKETMMQQVMTEPGKITFREIPIPEPGPDQVLVMIKKIGVCGTDIHVYHGTHPYTSYPVTQGHEVSGQIARVGECVRDLQVGQKVVIEPQVFCGRCYPCLHGKYNLCENLKVMGFQTTGTASEYFAVDACKVTPLPEDLTYGEGAMIEPLAVTVHAAKRFPELKGAKTVVLGCGPIGILLIQSLKALGAEKVLATDISDYRLKLAKELGADWAVNTAKEDFASALLEAYGPDKADVIYECAGSDITMDQAIQNARKGSTIILVAVFGKKATVDLAKLNDSELDLNTSMMYRHEDYVDAIRLVQDGKIRLKPLQSAHFAFADYLEAYRYIDDHRESTMKVLIDVDPTDP